MRYFVICIQLLIGYSLQSQCQNNLLENGSFNSSLGSDTAATGWIIKDGSPDVNSMDSLSILNLWGSNPVESRDGGTWQSLAGDTLIGRYTETLCQTITLDDAMPLDLSFEYASHRLLHPHVRDWKGFIRVEVNGTIVYETSITPELDIWYEAKVRIAPPDREMELCFTGDSDFINTGFIYMGIDGVCLERIKASMFCKDE